MHFIIFLLHLIITLGAWVFPFMVRWPIVLLVFGAVMLQFAMFGKCLVNEHHGVDEADDKIFYTDMLEKMGFHPNRKLVKFIVRKTLYPVLSVVAVIWQVVLGNAPLWF